MPDTLADLLWGTIPENDVDEDGRLIEVGFNTPLDGSRITYKLDSSVEN